MQEFVTPRQRDLIISGILVGGIVDPWVYMVDPCDGEFPPPPPTNFELGSTLFNWQVADAGDFSFGFPGDLFTIGASYEAHLIPPNGVPHGVQGTLTLTASLTSFPVYPGSTDSDSVVDAATVPHTFNFQNGSFTLTIPVEHCLEIPDSFGNILVGPNGWPIIDGAEVIDSAAAFLFGAFERPRAGTTITLTANFGGASVSCSLPVDNSPISGGRATGFYSIARYISGTTIGGGNGSLSIACTVGGQQLSEVMGTVSGSGTRCTYRGSDSGGTLSLQLANAQCEGVATIESWSASSPRNAYLLEGRLRAWNQPYPGSVLVDFAYKRDSVTGQPVVKQLSGPSYSDSIEQHRGTTWIRQGAVQLGFGSKDERLYPQAWMNKASLIANGEHPLDQRIMFVGRLFGSNSVAHASSLTIDAGSSTSGWAAGINTTVTSSGGAIHMAAAGGPGSATRTFSPKNEGHEGYRYLRLKLKADSNGRALRVTIGSKYWDLTLTTSYVDYDLDLVCPTNASAASDAQDSRWPLVSSATGEPAIDGPLWGVNWIDVVTFSQIANGATIDLDNWSCVRIGSAQVTLCEPFQDWQLAYPPEANSTTYFKRYLHVIVDGKQAFEERAAARVDGPVGSAYNIATIADLLSNLRQRPYLSSFSVIPSAWEDPPFFNNSRPAYWWGGNGAVYSGGVWVDYIEAGPTFLKQSLADSHGTYPGCGDPFSNTYPVDIRTPLRFTKILRWGAYGTVHALTQTPLSDAQVKIYVPPATLKGQGTTDSLGSYSTGLSFASAPPIAIIEPVMPSPPQVTEYGPNRKRRRAAFRAAVALCDSHPWNHEDHHDHFHRVCTKGGNVVYCHAFHSAPRPQFDIVSQITSSGDCSHPRIAVNRKGVIWLVYQRTILGVITCYRRFSTDKGRSFSAEELVPISGGSRITNGFSHNDEWYFDAEYVASTSKIMITRKRKGATAFETPIAVKNNLGVDLLFEDDDFHISVAKSNRRWMLSAKIQGEAAPSDWESTDSGKTYTRVI